MTRTCPECERRFEPRRPHQVYDSQECRMQGWVRGEVEAAEGAVKRVSRGVGSRGGNVRSVEEARALHDQHKAEITERVRRRIAETLLATGGFHADDLADLEVPEEHGAIIGSQTAAFACRKVMEKVGERKVTHKAANARKAGIYRITAKGRRELPQLVSVGGPKSASSATDAEPGSQRVRTADPDESEQLFPGYKIREAA